MVAAAAAPQRARCVSNLQVCIVLNMVCVIALLDVMSNSTSMHGLP